MPGSTEETARIWRALENVADPCLAAAGHTLSIVDMGLIYDIRTTDAEIQIDMTFTEPGCQFTHRVLLDAYAALDTLAEGRAVSVTPVWDPVWTEARLSARARETLALASAALAERFGFAMNTGA